MRAGPEAPRYLNTAFSELLQLPNGSARRSWPRPSGPGATPRACRGSSTPCSTRSSASAPRTARALPLELHLSLTGVCNMECRFCGYTHETARFDRVTPEQVGRLAFLALLRILRLNAALGEPTADPHLPAIVDRSRTRSPPRPQLLHNGVNLHGQGLIQASWAAYAGSASPEASTEKSWREVCQGPLLRAGPHQPARPPAGEARGRQPVPARVRQDGAAGCQPRGPPTDARAVPGPRRRPVHGFPYSAFTLDVPGRYGPEKTLDACRDRYEAVYEETIREAGAGGVDRAAVASRPQAGVVRAGAARLHDFARVETNEWPLDRFVDRLALPRPERGHCAFLWRQASVASTQLGQSPDESHYLNPCLGPLSRSTSPAAPRSASAASTTSSASGATPCSRAAGGTEAGGCSRCATPAAERTRGTRANSRACASWSTTLRGSTRRPTV